MVERVLVEEMGLVEEKDRVDAFLGQVLDHGRHGVEDRGRGRRRRQAQRDAELAIEVAAAERRVVAIGQAEAGVRDAMAEGPQDAGLADAGLTDEKHGAALAERVEQQSTTDLLRGRQPELAVRDLLGEGRLPEPEGGG